jgi:hypothetical protein
MEKDRGSGGDVSAGVKNGERCAAALAAKPLGRRPRAVSSSMPEWGLVAGSPDRCRRSSKHIHNFVLDGELWKGKGLKQRESASVHVDGAKRLGAWHAGMSVSRGEAAGYAGAGGSPGGSDKPRGCTLSKSGTLKRSTARINP